MTEPVEALETLKGLLDKELITEEEYNSRRSQVLDGLPRAPGTLEFALSGISELSVQVESAEKTGSAFFEAMPNFYKVRVPNNGTVRIVTRIRAVEEPTDDFHDRMRREYERLSARVPEIERLLAEMEKPDFVHTAATESERHWLELELRAAKMMLAHLEETRAVWDRP